MIKHEENELQATLETIRSRAHSLSARIATLGFDGFVDSVVKVIRHKDHHEASYFESVREFGEYTVERGEKNFSLELEELTTKLGGNMPIMANALAQFGLGLSCIGPLGHPAIHPVFQQMPQNCQLYSFANPGMSKVMEFRQGKIMLAEMEALNRVDWDLIRETIGVQTLRDLYTDRDLIALLNWSELDYTTDTWKGLLRDILPASPSRKRPLGFFDLSDCSKRSDETIREAMELIKEFSRYWDVTLSLNLNEATIVHGVLTSKQNTAVEKMCGEIFEKLNIQAVVIHYAQQSVARTADGLYKRNSFFLKNPVISCGSGDHFNAGFCLGRLMDLETGACLVLGHAISNLYMQSAQSPSIAAVLEFLSGHLSKNIQSKMVNEK